MAVTREFKDTVLTRLRNDPHFREAVLAEDVDGLLHDELGESAAPEPAPSPLAGESGREADG